MTLELAFNVAIGLVSALMGYVLRTVWETQQKMTKDLQDIQSTMNQEFLRKDDFRYLIDGINARFDRLESRLEHFFNHMKGPQQ